MLKRIVVLLFFAQVSFGQDISYLDQKNGFKNLELGKSIDEYSFLNKVDDRTSKFIFDMKMSTGPRNEMLNEMYSKVERLIPTVYNDFHYQYYVDENLDEYQKYPGNTGAQRVYVGTFQDLISDITIIMNSNNSQRILMTLIDVFGRGEGNLYDWHPLWSSLQIEGRVKKHYHKWIGNNVELNIKSIHYKPDGTGLKYERIIGWEVRYMHRDLYEKKIINKQRIEEQEGQKKAKELLKDF